MSESKERDDVVEMVRDARALGGRDRFSCTLDEWRSLLKLAQEFGWRPLGTTYELPSASKVEEAARRDYEPGEASDRKRIDADDSNALARALTDARSSERLAELTDESLRTLVSEFAQYAYGGAFMFVRSDAGTQHAP
jgi:hypothetical protein